MTKIYILHENDEWTVHLTNRLDELGAPYEKWHLSEGSIDLSKEPPEGIFYNRMSASSHTRGHRFAPEFTTQVIAWLEAHGRTVVNGSGAIRLEVSKVLQDLALRKHGVLTPKTVAAVGEKSLKEAVDAFDGQSFITKHNRAGKGLGVQLFLSKEGFYQYVDSGVWKDTVDGITLLQQYVQSPESYITRCEFINGKFLYAVRVDTSEGFELCPADACQIGDKFCPVGENEKRPKFDIIEGFNDPIIEKYEAFLQENDIQVAGIESVVDKEGNRYTYDVNTNTNYNKEAEEKVQVFAMKELALYLQQLLKGE
ncbi:ATP-grasp domain-containing protein [Mangrovibacillus cuniculi]|uniref:Alpha-L-glutamate ligase n=1 Tax=Mangrovibacillus cuniculi TaxID=2593652 RepID=A0A7S8C9K3_9BACI|nr:alpha-L-glutamate ligase [Mangrovibacillus cuniculi]QPC45931.1 alpha-L-glutamate ligase [Mangrovibacillus cuniculi]